MANNIVKVALYARVSTQEQATDGTSLEYQKSQLESCCSSQGWTIVQSYVDPGYTGKDDNRPGLKRLLADAKLGLFNKIVVYKMDRLARNLRLLLEIEEKFREYGVSFHSISEVIDTSTAGGHHFLQMLGMVSEWERENIIERTRAGRIQRYKEGCWGPGNPPYGYKYDSTTKKLVINQDEARVVRRIFAEYANSKTMAEIANGLNDEHVPPRGKKGKGWRSCAVRDITSNPVYIGKMIVNRQNVHISKLSENDLGKTITFHVPPIATEAQWQAVQEHRTNNKHFRPTPRYPWLLQGLIICGLCGYRFRTAITHGRRLYSCRGRLRYTHLDGSPKCISPNIDAELIEGEIWKRTEAIINDPDKLESLLKDTIESLKSKEAELAPRMKSVDERLSQISEQKLRLAEEWVQMSMGSDKCRELKRRLEEEEIRLNLVRSEFDPAQIEELEQTRNILRFWENQVRAMEWNLEDEEGHKVRIVDRPHRVALSLVKLEDKDISKDMHFPTSKRKLLDLLQMRAVIFHDRIEVKAVFPIKTIDCQLHNPDYRSGHSPQFQ